MLGRRLTFLLAGVVAAGALTAGPADAEATAYWYYNSHADGMPATDAPGSTLRPATVQLYDDAHAHASIWLEAAPDESSPVELHLAFGTPDEDGACVPASESVFAPDGRVTEVDLDVDPSVDGDSCTYVTLVDTATGDVLDRVDGAHWPWGQGYPGHPLRIMARQTGVRPHHWSSVVLHLDLGHDMSQVQVRAHGRQLHAVRVVQRDVPTTVRRVWLRVKLHVDSSRWLTIRASGTRPGYRRATARIRVHLLVRH